MNKGNRILSAILIAASIGFLFFLLAGSRDFSDMQMFYRPSYYLPVKLTMFYYLGGAAAALGILGCFFAWLRTRWDELESRRKAKKITEDAVRGTTGQAAAGGFGGPAARMPGGPGNGRIPGGNGGAPGRNAGMPG
ncbi:MAG: hypothetical protein Q4F29_00355, partial [Lachnospiraceae bacterium]|nr:hypothetical protein [Lachnospiraceae bacterium]